MSNLSAMFGGIVEDTNDLSNQIEKILTNYPVGSGSYSPLDYKEREAEGYFNSMQADLEGTVEGGRLQTLLGQLRALLASEREIASMQQIKGGQSTVEEETKKKAAYESERADQGLTYLTAAPEDVTPVGQIGGGGMMGTLLIIGAVGAGAYFIFK